MLVEETPTTAHALMAAPPEIELYANALRGAPSLSPITHLCIVDVTDGHTEDGVLDGRALAADGLEVLLVVVSERFAGLPLLARQRMVNSVLAADLASGRLHSVRMKCWTPAQWEGKCCPHSFNPGEPCPLASPVLQLPCPALFNPSIPCSCCRRRARRSSRRRARFASAEVNRCNIRSAEAHTHSQRGPTKCEPKVRFT